MLSRCLYPRWQLPINTSGASNAGATPSKMGLAQTRGCGSVEEKLKAPGDGVRIALTEKICGVSERATMSIHILEKVVWLKIII